MKKVLFMSLAMAVAMTGFAQRAVVSNDAKNASATAKKPAAARQIDGSAVEGIQFNMAKNMVSNRSLEDFDEYTTMTTNYDLQSNSALGNRIATWADGSASFVATWDHSMNTGFPDRGAGYNFYTPDMKGMGDEPEVRQEPMKSGWPTIAACGEGEVLASHATGTNVYYRPTKGQGEWELVTNLNFTWPRVVCSGENDEYIHIVGAEQISMPDGSLDNHVYYVRIKHEGDSWDISEPVDFPGLDNELNGAYRNQLSADDYVMAANGNNVAVMMASYTTDVFYMISHDNGETWEHQVVAPYGIAGADGEPVHAIAFDDYPEGMTDSIVTSDNSHSIAIDDNGTVHVAFGLLRWRVSDATHYTSWPGYSFGIVYWNSDYVNEEGGHEILPYGRWSQDSQFPSYYADRGFAYTLINERIDAMAEVDGRQHLNYFGIVDENMNGTIDIDFNTYISNSGWNYRSIGTTTMPAISVDNLGNVAIAFSTLSEIRVNGANGCSYRTLYVTLKDAEGNWLADEYGINLCEDFMHEYDEAYPCVAATNGYNAQFWVAYSADENQGLYLDISDSNPNSNMGVLTENYIYACLIRPEGWGVEENEAVNPMTATRVYPNPATDVLNIEVNASQASEMSISVYNIMGQNVMNQNVNITTGMNTRSISTSELSSGIYFVTVKANGFENTMKFIVK